MKLIGLLLAVSMMLGCSGSQPTFNQKAVHAPLTLTPPSTSPAPRKVFQGKGWLLSVEDDGWHRGSSDDAVLALMNITARSAVMLERHPNAGTLEEFALKTEENFSPSLHFTKTEAVVAGYPGYRYDAQTRRSQVWGWMAVVNGTAYFLVCATALSMAETNFEMCEDISKHLVLTKVKP